MSENFVASLRNGQCLQWEISPIRDTVVLPVMGVFYAYTVILAHSTLYTITLCSVTRLHTASSVIFPT